MTVWSLPVIRMDNRLPHGRSPPRSGPARNVHGSPTSASCVGTPQPTAVPMPTYVDLQLSRDGSASIRSVQRGGISTLSRTSTVSRRMTRERSAPPDAEIRSLGRPPPPPPTTAPGGASLRGSRDGSVTAGRPDSIFSRARSTRSSASFKGRSRRSASVPPGDVPTPTQQRAESSHVSAGAPLPAPTPTPSFAAAPGDKPSDVEGVVRMRHRGLLGDDTSVSCTSRPNQSNYKLAASVSAVGCDDADTGIEVPEAVEESSATAMPADSALLANELVEGEQSYPSEPSSASQPSASPRPESLAPQAIPEGPEHLPDGDLARGKDSALLSGAQEPSQASSQKSVQRSIGEGEPASGDQCLEEKAVEEKPTEVPVEVTPTPPPSVCDESSTAEREEPAARGAAFVSKGVLGDNISFSCRAGPVEESLVKLAPGPGVTQADDDTLLPVRPEAASQAGDAHKNGSPALSATSSTTSRGTNAVTPPMSSGPEKDIEDTAVELDEKGDASILHQGTEQKQIAEVPAAPSQTIHRVVSLSENLNTASALLPHAEQQEAQPKDQHQVYSSKGLLGEDTSPSCTGIVSPSAKVQGSPPLVQRMSKGILAEDLCDSATSLPPSGFQPTMASATRSPVVDQKTSKGLFGSDASASCVASSAHTKIADSLVSTENNAYAVESTATLMLSQEDLHPDLSEIEVPPMMPAEGPLMVPAGDRDAGQVERSLSNTPPSGQLAQADLTASQIGTVPQTDEINASEVTLHVAETTSAVREETLTDKMADTERSVPSEQDSGIRGSIGESIGQSRGAGRRAEGEDSDFMTGDEGANDEEEVLEDEEVAAAKEKANDSDYATADEEEDTEQIGPTGLEGASGVNLNDSALGTPENEEEAHPADSPQGAGIHLSADADEVHHRTVDDVPDEQDFPVASDAVSLPEGQFVKSECLPFRDHIPTELPQTRETDEKNEGREVSIEELQPTLESGTVCSAEPGGREVSIKESHPRPEDETVCSAEPDANSIGTARVGRRFEVDTTGSICLDNGVESQQSLPLDAIGLVQVAEVERMPSKISERPSVVNGTKTEEERRGDEKFSRMSPRHSIRSRKPSITEMKSVSKASMSSKSFSEGPSRKGVKSEHSLRPAEEVVQLAASIMDALVSRVSSAIQELRSECIPSARKEEDDYNEKTVPSKEISSSTAELPDSAHAKVDEEILGTSTLTRLEDTNNTPSTSPRTHVEPALTYRSECLTSVPKGERTTEEVPPSHEEAKPDDRPPSISEPSFGTQEESDEGETEQETAPQPSLDVGLEEAPFPAPPIHPEEASQVSDEPEITHDECGAARLAPMSRGMRTADHADDAPLVPYKNECLRSGDARPLSREMEASAYAADANLMASGVLDSHPGDVAFAPAQGSPTRISVRSPRMSRVSSAISRAGSAGLGEDVLGGHSLDARAPTVTLAVNVAPATSAELRSECIAQQSANDFVVKSRIQFKKGSDGVSSEILQHEDDPQRRSLFRKATPIPPIGLVDFAELRRLPDRASGSILEESDDGTESSIVGRPTERVFCTCGYDRHSQAAAMERTWMTADTISRTHRLRRCSDCGGECIPPPTSFTAGPDAEGPPSARGRQLLARAREAWERELGPLHDTLQRLQEKVRALDLPELRSSLPRRSVSHHLPHSPASPRRLHSRSASSVLMGSPMARQAADDLQQSVSCPYCGLQLVPESALSPLARMYILLAQPRSTGSSQGLPAAHATPPAPATPPSPATPQVEEP